MNQPMTSKVLVCLLDANERHEALRESDGILTEEERKEAELERLQLRVVARTVYLNERVAMQALRIDFDNAPDHNLTPAINELDALRQELERRMEEATGDSESLAA